MSDVPLKARFVEKVRRLINENFGPQYPAVIEDASVVNRRQIEDRGRCREFLDALTP